MLENQDKGNDKIARILFLGFGIPLAILWGVALIPFLVVFMMGFDAGFSLWNIFFGIVFFGLYFLVIAVPIFLFASKRFKQGLVYVIIVWCTILALMYHKKNKDQILREEYKMERLRKNGEIPQESAPSGFLIPNDFFVPNGFKKISEKFGNAYVSMSYRKNKITINFEETTIAKKWQREEKGEKYQFSHENRPGYIIKIIPHPNSALGSSNPNNCLVYLYWDDGEKYIRITITGDKDDLEKDLSNDVLVGMLSKLEYAK